MAYAGGAGNSRPALDDRMKQGRLVGWLRATLILALAWLARDLVVPVVQALAWPVAMVTVLFMFRDRLDEVLARVPALRRLKAGGVEAEFGLDQEVEAAEAEAGSPTLQYRMGDVAEEPADVEEAIDA